MLIDKTIEWDPDILCGYEIQLQSWKYLIDRCWSKYGLNLCVALSRFVHAPASANMEPFTRPSGAAMYNAAKTNELDIGGRVVLNAWRIMRAELTLTSYSFENVCYHLLHERVPYYTPWQLYHWWCGTSATANTAPTTAATNNTNTTTTTTAPTNNGNNNGTRSIFDPQSACGNAHLNAGSNADNDPAPITEHAPAPTSARWRVVRHYTHRVQACANMLIELDFVQRNSEYARLFGMLFEEVQTRGSQFRVESIMIRLAHAENYVMSSPSKEQIKGMNAPREVARILEPESNMYTDPVVVLDFQSLYPSIMIAWNISYDTCLGNVPRHDTEYNNPVNKLGASTYCPPPGLLASLGRAGINVAPTECGTMFCTSKHRVGILPQMLSDILETRVMVKQSKKRLERQNVGTNSTRIRLLEARQLGLKLIANVTYGYTSANMSGRMPCVDMADSIVSLGKWTLDRAIDSAEVLLKDYNARVVYGDTDSLFLLIPGVSTDKAHELGQWAANKLSQTDPHPMKLKFEKVYLPCVLQTKKRYVGFKFENPGQTQPEFEAKGIETVRRDGCGVVRMMLEQTIKILFRTRDLSKVAEYVKQQWTKMYTEDSGMAGALNLVDYIIAKEYRGARSTPGAPDGAYKANACVAALMLAELREQHDRRSVPRVGERVPYVVCLGEGIRIIDNVYEPHDAVRRGLKVNIKHYIEKMIIPALNRVLSVCVGSDALLKSWHQDVGLPHPKPFAIGGERRKNQRNTLSQQWQTATCLLCSNNVAQRPSTKKRHRPAMILCVECIGSNGQPTLRSQLRIQHRLQSFRRKHAQLTRLCRSCTGFPVTVTDMSANGASGASGAKGGGGAAFGMTLHQSGAGAGLQHTGTRGVAAGAGRSDGTRHGNGRGNGRAPSGPSGVLLRSGRTPCESASCPVYYEVNAAAVRLYNATRVQDAALADMQW